MNFEAYYQTRGRIPFTHEERLYINILIPGLYFIGILDSNRRYLNNLGY
jgi:hypothetical protein